MYFRDMVQKKIDQSGADVHNYLQGLPPKSVQRQMQRQKERQRQRQKEREKELLRSSEIGCQIKAESPSSAQYNPITAETPQMDEQKRERREDSEGNEMIEECEEGEEMEKMGEMEEMEKLEEKRENCGIIGNRIVINRERYDCQNAVRVEFMEKELLVYYLGHEGESMKMQIPRDYIQDKKVNYYQKSENLMVLMLQAQIESEEEWIHSNIISSLNITIYFPNTQSNHDSLRDFFHNFLERPITGLHAPSKSSNLLLTSGRFIEESRVSPASIMPNTRGRLRKLQEQKPQEYNYKEDSSDEQEMQEDDYDIDIEKVKFPQTDEPADKSAETIELINKMTQEEKLMVLNEVFKIKKNYKFVDSKKNKPRCPISQCGKTFAKPALLRSHLDKNHPFLAKNGILYDEKSQQFEYSAKALDLALYLGKMHPGEMKKILIATKSTNPR